MRRLAINLQDHVPEFMMIVKALLMTRCVLNKRLLGALLDSLHRFTQGSVPRGELRRELR